MKAITKLNKNGYLVLSSVISISMTSLGKFLSLKKIKVKLLSCPGNTSWRCIGQCSQSFRHS